jgi:hypothetical protein
MPIKVTCKCGQTFAAKDELAGKVVKCPKCKQPLKIGSPAAKRAAQPPVEVANPGISDLLDEIGFHVHEDEKENVQHCPACDAEMSDHAILCVQCGYNLETGKYAKGAGVAAAGGRREGHAGAADRLLQRAEHAIETDKQEETKMRKQGMPTWLLATMLCILVVFGVAMSLLPRSTALVISGITWMSALGLALAYFHIKLIIVAFSEGVAQGLMYLFVPFYSLYYVITRWDNCGNLFLATIFLSMLWNVGWALINAAAAFPDTPDEDNAAANHFAREQVVVSAPSLLPSGAPPHHNWNWSMLESPCPAKAVQRV